ncbi:linear amidine hydrolase [Trypanosoma conorhini]|uniref:Linear amidine hydrolase n=1 Tax=Trypanosoma conorhini TaxID=83891 RepID=A0A422PSN1_9TRYP|nr:linear amidine hydrolase [Trypanosoma conorhini]RNF20755.1 linear amidine hydrolase [Trypanosoma conorhini]
MATFLLLQDLYFGSKIVSPDNHFIAVPQVSESQGQQDNCMVAALQRNIEERLVKDAKAKVIYLSITGEPRSTRCAYETHFEALFVNDSLSVHHVTDAEGTIKRRLIILYPMSKKRRGELPKVQLLRKLDKTIKAEEPSGLELLDLRHFENDGKVLEGMGAMNFSYNGEFVYMALSPRSNEEVLDVVCSPENLNIPERKRFIFTAVVPRLAENGHGAGEDVVHHTNLIGWCGKGICAWGLEFLRFPSEEKKNAFYEHLEATYSKIINLNAEEIRAFAGNACELLLRTEEGERQVLCISNLALSALRNRNLKLLEEWYGKDNIFIFYGETLERRSGTSVGGLICRPITHGEVLPAPGQVTALEVARVDEKVVCPVVRR